MSSDKDNKASTNDPKGATEGKQAAPGDHPGSKSADSQHAPSAGGHEETGAEKFVTLGGSGGVTIRTGQGYETLANH